MSVLNKLGQRGLSVFSGIMNAGLVGVIFIGGYAANQTYGDHGYDKSDIEAVERVIAESRDYEAEISFPAPPGSLPVKLRGAVEPDQHTMNGLIKTESNWNPKARSKAGAIGYTQLKPETAREVGVNPHDPKDNIKGGRRYLSKMMRRYNDETLALLAYNWGPGAVDRWLKRGGDISKLPKESREYITKVKLNAAVSEWQMAQR